MVAAVGKTTIDISAVEAPRMVQQVEQTRRTSSWLAVAMIVARRNNCKKRGGSPPPRPSPPPRVGFCGGGATGGD